MTINNVLQAQNQTNSQPNSSKRSNMHFSCRKCS